MNENAVNQQIVCRLLPQTRSNRHRLERTLEAQRILHNTALDERIDRRRKTGSSISWIDQCKELTKCRNVRTTAASSA